MSKTCDVRLRSMPCLPMISPSRGGPVTAAATRCHGSTGLKNRCSDRQIYRPNNDLSRVNFLMTTVDNRRHGAGTNEYAIRPARPTQHGRCDEWDVDLHKPQCKTD